MEFWFCFQLLKVGHLEQIPYTTTISSSQVISWWRLLSSPQLHSQPLRPLSRHRIRTTRYSVVPLVINAMPLWELDLASIRPNAWVYPILPTFARTIQMMFRCAPPFDYVKFFLTSLHSVVWMYPATYQKWRLATAVASKTMAARVAISMQGFAQGTRTSNAASKSLSRRHRRRRRCYRCHRLPRQTLALRLP